MKRFDDKNGTDDKKKRKRILFMAGMIAVIIITAALFYRSRSAYDKVIYCQSFLQTGSYVLYFIIWTYGEIVKQNVTMHI